MTTKILYPVAGYKAPYLKSTKDTFKINDRVICNGITYIVADYEEMLRDLERTKELLPETYAEVIKRIEKAVFI